MRAAQLLVGDLALAGIGYVPQGREIFPQLTVLENLKIGLMANPRRPCCAQQVAGLWFLMSLVQTIKALAMAIWNRSLDPVKDIVRELTATCPSPSPACPPAP